MKARNILLYVILLIAGWVAGVFTEDKYNVIKPRPFHIATPSTPQLNLKTEQKTLSEEVAEYALSDGSTSSTGESTYRKMRSVISSSSLSVPPYTIYYYKYNGPDLLEIHADGKIFRDIGLKDTCTNSADQLLYEEILKAVLFACEKNNLLNK